MKESTFTLPTPDDKTIYGILNACGDTPAERAVVISHGLTGHPNEHQHLKARRYFNALGYDVYRFCYYAGADDARKLIDCTLKIHAADLNQVCDFVRPQHKKLFLIGHSYGGLTVLFANPAATAISFWESSFTPYEGFWRTSTPKLPGTPYYIHGWGSYNLINPAMLEEAQNLTEADSIALAHRIQSPSQVILAGDSNENPIRTGLFDALLCPKELVDIPGADHIFSRNDTVQTLVETTGAWFEKF